MRKSDVTLFSFFRSGGPAATALLAASLLAGCTGGGGDDDEGGSPPDYKADAATSVVDLRVSIPGSGDSDVTVKPVGERVIDGETYQELELQDSATGQPAGVKGVVQANLDSMEIVSIELDADAPGAVSPIDLTVTLDEPLTIGLNPPLGEVQATSVSGSIVAQAPNGEKLNFTGAGDATWTRVETNATALTPMGEVTGCDRYEFTVSIATIGLQVSGETWAKEGVGFVGLIVDTEMFGRLTVGLVGYGGYEVNGDTVIMKRGGVIGPGRPLFRLDTYDRLGQFDADKDQHAVMYLEMRFADAEKARGTERPPAVEEFGTVWGWFPAMLAMSPVGLFDPEGSGQGVNHWIAVVNQAAKNETENPMSYHISVEYPDYGSSEVQVNAMIVYKRYNP